MDFIEKWDGLFSQHECEYIIEYFHSCEKLNITFSRQGSEGSGILQKKDQAVGTNLLQTLDKKSEAYVEFGPVSEMLDDKLMGYCLPEYCNKYGLSEKLYNGGYKIQKTEPTGGYHLWHYEQDNNLDAINRRLAYMVYLNDVEHGGETEFLHQSKRYSPTRGTMMIWPAGFTHQHRGNPPLSGTKFILTGWMKAKVD